MNKHSRIYVAGHEGLVGSAIVRRLQNTGYDNIIVRSHAQLDLTKQREVNVFFTEERPEYVFLAAAKVGGIAANIAYPAEFFYQNMSIALNVISAAKSFGVNKLINLGSSCIYPRLAPQPLKEEYLLSGPLEPTNEAYALAKIAAIKMCVYYNNQYRTNFLSLMPTNLYGPGDNYNLSTSHVLPAMIIKFHNAKLNGGPVSLWGDGSPMREFLYSEDFADAAVMLMEKHNAQDIGELMNVGSGSDLTIRELARIISDVVEYNGNVVWDTSKPNGTPRKLLDITRLSSFGWKPKIDLSTGIKLTYAEFLKKANEE